LTKLRNERVNIWAAKNVNMNPRLVSEKNMSTIDNVFILHGNITHLININKILYPVFVDYTKAKAFDYLVNDVILYKLIKFGGKMLHIIRSMFENVRSRVQYNSTISEEFVCYLGVRKGESLSSFLFSMYLNDVEEYFMLNGFEGIRQNLIFLL
jgi:hypothetical protein